jgi:PRTRC genetic system protein B
MNEVQIVMQSDKRLVLRHALLMYQSHDGNQVYATTHAIEPDANNPERRIIGAGAPMTKRALAEFARAVNTATAYAGFVQRNLVYTSANLLAWWVPAAVRSTWFKSDDKAINDRHGAVAHPALVFIATPVHWYVFALQNSERPDSDTPLYHAPHFNVWDGGRICTGNVALPPALSADALDAYEEAFFRSHFTHPNRKGAVKYKGGMPALWRDQLDKPDADTMRSALVPAKETLKAAIKRITQAQ